MDGEIDLTTADRDTLNAVIVRQRAIIERLEQRIAQLEGPAKPSGSRRMHGLKRKAQGKPGQGETGPA
jgi:BMFP domain-containing protein YqiC